MTVEEFDKKLNEAANRYVAAVKATEKAWLDELGELFEGLGIERHLVKAVMVNVMDRIKKELDE